MKPLIRVRVVIISISSTEDFFFFSSRRRHTRFKCDWSSDVCSSDLLPWQRELSSRGAGHRVHCEAESFLTCYKHTFMSGTCQRHALQRTDISWWAARLIMTAILIRARSVVQVHPGPPFKSPIYKRRFSLSPSGGLVIKKPFCQKFAKSRVGDRSRNPGRSHARPALCDCPDGTTVSQSVKPRSKGRTASID